MNSIGSNPTKSPSTYSSSPITISSTTTLKFFSVDKSGNAEPVKTETYTKTVKLTGTIKSIADKTDAADLTDIQVKIKDAKTMTKTKTGGVFSLNIAPSNNNVLTFAKTIAGKKTINEFTVKGDKTATEYTLDGIIIPAGSNKEKVKTLHTGIWSDSAKTLTLYIGVDKKDSAIGDNSVSGTYSKGKKYQMDGYETGHSVIVTKVSVDSKPTTEDKASGTFDDTGKLTITINIGKGTPETVELYNDTTLPTTTASPDTGTYTSPQDITLACADNGGSGCNKTYYTIDRSDPDESSLIYSTPISISTTTTLKYFSTDNAGNKEAVKTATYTF